MTQLTTASGMPWTDNTFQRKAYAIEMALRFVWGCQRQINRFTEGFSTRPDLHWDLPKGIVAPVDAQRTYDLYRTDGYMVLTLAWQAARWLSIADTELDQPAGTHALQPALVEKVHVLRDVYEHWDEQVESFRAGTRLERSGRRFRAAYPHQNWPGDAWKADLAEGATLDDLHLKDLFADLTRVEASLLDAQRELWHSIGLTVPDGDYTPITEWRFFVGFQKVED